MLARRPGTTSRAGVESWLGPLIRSRSRTRQPGQLGETRGVHAPAAVARGRLEVHPAVVAVVESEGESAPGDGYDRGEIEVGYPVPADGHLDVGDGRGVTGVGSDAQEPGLPRAGGIEREPHGIEAVTRQHFGDEARSALFRVLPGTGDWLGRGGWNGTERE